MPPVSIIIPVYNQWQFTRNCLRSLKATLDAEAAEVILVDNASTDVTPGAAAFLGGELFGDNFKYIRNEQNRNFAGASNQGAFAADGDFLVFLNNDTEVQQGWLAPLLADFRDFPNLGGTGPLLVYPEKPILGHTVQHLGVAVSPFRKFSHLYEGIPANSSLAQKRRFFQIITAACLLMPKELFKRAAGFDEGYKNGFEDVDLCVRLAAEGLRFTVNPAARVIHYQGQTAGRNAAEAENAAHMYKRIFHLLKPDKADLIAADGMSFGLNAWQIATPLLSSHLAEQLDASLAGANRSELLAALREQPCWQKGWQRLFAELAPAQQADAARTIYRLIPEAEIPLAAAQANLAIGNREQARYWFNTAAAFCQPAAVYEDVAQRNAQYARELGEPEIAHAYANWPKDMAAFTALRLRPFFSEFARVAAALGIKASGTEHWSFALQQNAQA